MKKIFIPLFLLFAHIVHAQLNNSWIDYSKTYYKFRIGTTGLYRISESTLANAGLGSVPAEQFQLWHNGKEERVYTSQPTGQLSLNDYIEFWGRMNDGSIDKPLYLNPNGQMCDSFSLFTDTAAYYLTVNPAGGNLRYTAASNNISGNTLSADKYFMRSVSKPYKVYQCPGYAADVGDFVYSAAYDIGEGWASGNIFACCGDYTEPFSALNVYTGGPVNAFSCYLAAFGNDDVNRNIHLKISNQTVIDTAVYGFSVIKKEVDSLPLSLLQNNTQAVMGIDNSTDPVNDRIVVGLLSFTYPATFNFNGAQNFCFDLQPSATGNYLVISNFNNGSTQPVLYDITNGLRYLGDISVTGQVRFALPASMSTSRKFLLVNEENGNITTVNSLSSRNFINFGLAANQGDYLIISNPVLYNDGSGNNNVEAYRAYRSSISGGSYNAKVIDVHELDDQFAFGVKKDPAAIRDFIRYSQTWAVQPGYVFIIGRGLTSLEYRSSESNPAADELDLVQTFGWPASDVLLSATPGTETPLVPIGRLPAINGTEVGNYLQKMEEYEQAEQSQVQTIENKGWMKNFVHIVGGADSNEDAQFAAYMGNYGSIAKDTLYGANVSTFRKNTSDAVAEASGTAIADLINGGVGFIGYFGHSSANVLAFNLSDANDFQNQGKYPFFNVSGCAAGDFYSFDTTRLAGNYSISENFQLTKERGSIGFLADTHLGITSYLDQYNTQLYTNFCQKMYGNTIGNQLKQVISTLSNEAASDYFGRITLEELALDGDPALRIYNSSLPDYVVEDQYVKISPSIISVSDSSFNVDVSWMNIGRAVDDSMLVTIDRQLPNGTLQVLYSKEILATKYMDSVNLVVKINPLTDVGTNKIIVTLNANQQINEITTANNTDTKSFQIFQDELNPVYPYNYSIINDQGITYTASTANPLSGQRQYLMEIDTTALFNSPFMKQYTTSGIGGTVQFTPANIAFTDSTVYYWRVAVSPQSSEPLIWNGYSFIYLATGGTGFNQSHYYQHLQSDYSNISLDPDRVFRFSTVPKNLIIRTGIYPNYTYDRINVNLDFKQLEFYGCGYDVLQFFVYDTSTLLPWANYNTINPVTHLPQGRFGSDSVCGTPPPPAPPVRYFFEFPYGDAASRKLAMNFLDSIPNGMYVSITNFGESNNQSFISNWQADTATLGSGNSLYNSLKSLGFTDIDSFTHNIPFIFFYKKNSTSFTPLQYIGTIDSNTTATIPLLARLSSGTITSPLFGPAKSWQSLHWRGKSIEPVSTDSVQIQVYGVKNDGSQTLMATVAPSKDTSLSFIDATAYPYIKLEMLNSDTVNLTPNQLTYWRINGQYVPEGAVAPNILYNFQDTVSQGQNINFAMAFKNISPVNFDSLTTLMTITDQNNATHTIPLPKGKALVAGDTMTVNYVINTTNYPGNNTLYVMVNPNYAQPEQYLYNNFVYQNFYVKPDNINPLLDVTFDGIHILNRDIVSAKPHVIIKLTDESKYLALNDTSMVTVKIQYPDGSIHNYYYSDSLRFTPANLATGTNVATIDLLPDFPLDGEYLLMVSGKDANGNPAGALQYEVAFQIKNAAMISNLLNYPNPFTTSTAFVFTVTGVVPPQNIRIEILTVTGKIVREITSAELGPINIGRNITQFKWDGTDMYGQKLANGVYLYRVLTNLNGKALGNYKSQDYIDNNVDQYFTDGYGKMYLMR